MGPKAAWRADPTIVLARHIMELEISEEALRRTTQCPHEFACLNNGEHHLCTPLVTMGKGGLLIKEGAVKRDPYRVSFGNSWLCICPVRREIWDMYWR
jgi:hypothetical protein